jgi:hypothetical protein
LLNGFVLIIVWNNCKSRGEALGRFIVENKVAMNEERKNPEFSSFI